ncbi:elicitor-responsive protein 3-like isoform X3 [Papaver somniferum]|uniref:elicitor-responsive protein 3-like isoform X3 n=1 Tax=Papaver somniferum TaxID=3469 RepID=UPI000E6F5463|nr:elicitor-responsive protein 3-like isoform X3 [Papaver somniferum]
MAGLSLEMNKEGIVEILLVSAQDIRNPNFIGKPCYYVIAHCGKQEVRSKTVSGDHKKAVWNEKLVLRFPLSDLENMAHLKLKIMDTSKFSNDGNFIGETRIHLGGVITDKGFIELKPSRYKVVLEDDRYKGEIKIGLKFNKLIWNGLDFWRAMCKQRPENVSTLSTRRNR